MRYADYLQSAHWKALRVRKFAQVGRACNRCKSTAEPLHVHHKRYGKLFDVSLSDLEVLCAKCHEAHHRLHPTKKQRKKTKKQKRAARKLRRRKMSDADVQRYRERRKEQKAANHGKRKRSGTYTPGMSLSVSYSDE